MSGDAMLESKPVRNGEKWSEFITGHKHIVHIFDVSKIISRIFLTTASLFTIVAFEL